MQSKNPAVLGLLGPSPDDKISGKYKTELQPEQASFPVRDSVQ